MIYGYHYSTLFPAIYNSLYRIFTQKQKNNQPRNILILRKYHNNINPTSTDIGFFLFLLGSTLKAKDRAPGPEQQIQNGGIQ